MVNFPQVAFHELFLEPTRNGIYKTKEFHGRGSKIVNMGELFGYEFIGSQNMKLVELSEKEKKNYLLKDGDLLFGRRSLVESGSGKCSIVQGAIEEMTFESSIIRVRPNPKKVNPVYLYYYFKSDEGRSRILAISSGTNVKGIRGSDLQNIHISLPEPYIQDRIVQIVQSYDHLIENNNRRIAILQEMARNLYREWFVKFRFPGHEEVKMIDSELGQIPEGWDIKETADLLKRLTVKAKYTQENVEMVGSIPVIDQSRDEVLGFHDHQADVVANNDFPIAIFGDHTCKMQLLVEPFSIGPNVIPFTSKIDRPMQYVFYLVNSLVTTKEYKRHWTELISKEVVVAPQNITENFSNLIKPLLAQINLLKKKNQNLKTQRDMLLPKLISGKILIFK